LVVSRSITADLSRIQVTAKSMCRTMNSICFRNKIRRNNNNENHWWAYSRNHIL